MNLLIIGDLQHQYNKNFLSNLLECRSDYNLIGINWGTSQLTNEERYSKVYKTFFYFKIFPSIFNKFISFLVFFFSMVSFKKQDVVIIQYIHPWLIFFLKIIKKKTSTLIIAPWGSDIYRRKDNSFDTFVRYADIVVAGSPHILSEFKEKYAVHSEKIKLCFFGSAPIDYIAKVKKDRCESLNLFGLSDLRNIVIGHNGSVFNRHLDVLDCISKVDVDKKQYRIVLPMTYGLSSDYYLEVKNKCESLGLEYIILTEFMTEKKVAHLRNITDVFINVQTTDGFSGSMRESLYVGSIIITGSWLPYSFLKDRGVYFEEVQDFKDFELKLRYVINNFVECKNKAKRNSDIIYEMTSWKKTIYNWIDIIEKSS